MTLPEVAMRRALQLSFLLSVAGTLLGYPACVYGFFMFLALTLVTGLGLRAASRDVMDAGTLGASRG